MSTYRNISTNLAVIELSGNWQRGGWAVAGDVAYTRGQDKTDDMPLAQIAPLMGKISASYGQDAWRAGARVNFAATQDRIDPSRDAGVTPGHATMDLFSSYDVADNAVFMAGVENVFDKAYSNHLSRGNAFDTSVSRVMEPGRSVYVKLEMRF